MLVRRMIAAILQGLVALQAQAEPGWPTAEALAEAREEVAPLVGALGLEPLLWILRDEGITQGAMLEHDLFPGRGGHSWPDRVAGIYAVPQMLDVMAWELAAGLDPEDRAAAVTFYSSDLGQRIVELEITARKAMLEPTVEATSNEYLAMLRDDGAPRLDLLGEFVAVNDLLDANVATALNANLAFMTGLNEGGGYGARPRPQGEILDEVWGQEAEIRQQTALWVMSYLAMAFQPLNDAELRAYIAFCRDDSGHRLNAELFKAYNVLFGTISRDLGMAAAQYMIGEDL